MSLPRTKDIGRALTVLVLGLGAAVAVAMVCALGRDAAYALGSATAAPLGDLASVSSAVLRDHENRAVHGEGLVGLAGAVRFERPLRAGTFRILPVLGRTDLWVELPLRPGAEGGRWEPPQTFTGRLVELDRAGLRHRGLREAIEQAADAPLPKDAWLVIDGETPALDHFSLWLLLVFLACAIYDSVLLARVAVRMRS